MKAIILIVAVFASFAASAQSYIGIDAARSKQHINMGQSNPNIGTTYSATTPSVTSPVLYGGYRDDTGFFVEGQGGRLGRRTERTANFSNCATCDLTRETNSYYVAVLLGKEFKLAQRFSLSGGLGLAMVYAHNTDQGISLQPTPSTPGNPLPPSPQATNSHHYSTDARPVWQIGARYDFGIFAVRATYRQVHSVSDSNWAKSTDTRVASVGVEKSF